MANPFKSGKRIWLLLMICMLLSSYFALSNVSDAIKDGGIEQPSPDSLSIPLTASMEPLYSQILKQWKEQGAKDVTVSELKLRAADFKNASPGVTVQAEPLQGVSDTVALDEGQWVEYEVDVPQSGLYQLRLQYYSIEDSNIPIQIGVAVDGESPYVEAKGIELDRLWKDDQFPPRVDGKDNQIRPGQVAIKDWIDRTLVDSSYAASEPLRWYLEQGKRTIRIQSVFEPIALSGLGLHAPRQVEQYEAVQANYSKDSSDKSDWYTTIEAEQMLEKSEPSVQMQASRDDLARPKSDGKIIFNTMGGGAWFRGGQSATWTFEVPEDGLYKIDMKYFQGYNKESNSYRMIEIDGEVPFQELQAFPFTYKRNWSMETLGSSAEEPFLFELAKGKHELSMTVTNAPVTPIVESIQYITREVQEINRLLRLVTGVRSKDNLDKNRDWNLAEQLPDIEQRLLDMKQSLEQILSYLQQLYGNDVNGAAAIRASIDKLQRLADDPNELPFKPEYLSSVQESLSSYAIELTKQPLMLDQIYISKATTELPDFAPSRWEITKNTVKTFFLTFNPDYIDYGRQDEDAAITVWVNRGRDYVTLMQQMVDERFTPSTGIKVNINIMPNPQLLILSNAANREPDVAMGLDQLTPVDFAVRNALLDLNQFADYKEVAKQFLPGSLLPFHYDKGDYALPETIMFNVMFYRKDILEELKLKVPETWNDIYDLLPTLQQKGYDFFYQPMMYLPLFYQNAASFYTPDGMKTGLDSPQAFDAFKRWTDFFNIYGLPREVPNFYMHFRNGNMPIGIADFNTYLQLLVAAPEISGLWSVAPLPGTKNEDGEIERWGGGGLQSGAIFKSTEHPEESWQFLKWWTSTETQSRFGNDMEMFNGIEFRWNTANKEAFKQIPWPSEHGSEIAKQLNWFKEMPNVPGGYFTTRELSFAWNRTVLENMNFRESLENAVFEINRELLRKQQEFGFVDKDGQIIRTLDIPQIEKPTGGGTEDE
ncbi:extracellular solute-binding protein [Paenibacillus mendelii]|uniref:Extracellular solute-binding protein n=1 Tax=Paenibacillus mendelii TaxID=206163 RepID=A0ABV6JJR5_9BACL|nr:extracellular solute-binding protein [Paenibacillus mendelii]MCQ6559093.1 extracellular solute-binding protein [Paenibacillus mendelii]